MLFPSPQQGDMSRILAAAQSHHVRRVRTVEVGIDQADSDAKRAERQRNIHRYCRLTNAALAACDCDDRHLIGVCGHAVSVSPGRVATILTLQRSLAVLLDRADELAVITPAPATP
jgi:hypothetical protein